MIDFSRFTGTLAPPPERWQFFTPAEFAALPAVHRDQLLFLDEDSTRAAYAAASAHRVVCGDGWGHAPFSGDCYPSVERFALREPPPGRLRVLKKWLYRRGLPFGTDVLLLPVFRAEHDPAVVSTWKMLVKYPEAFFSFDNVIATGASAGWCLYYHHDDIFHFAQGRHSAPPAKTTH